MQDTEVEQLKLRLKQYADYDEIKRELDIMKVLLPHLPPPPTAPLINPHIN